MGRFRKRPVEVEAWELTSDNIAQMYELVNNAKINYDDLTWRVRLEHIIETGLDIPTLEDGTDKRAKHVARLGDYIIKGIQGELYPCKPDIFKATYEEIK
jgi:hypothetical protein